LASDRENGCRKFAFTHVQKTGGNSAEQLLRATVPDITLSGRDHKEPARRQGLNLRLAAGLRRNGFGYQERQEERSGVQEPLYVLAFYPLRTSKAHRHRGNRPVGTHAEQHARHAEDGELLHGREPLYAEPLGAPRANSLDCRRTA
jgi:hypothetical protein